MKNALLLSALLLIGCKDNPLSDPASQLAGTYRVSNYMVDNDTLISAKTGNISAYPNLSIVVTRESDNSIQVVYTTDPTGSRGGTGVAHIRVESSNNRYNLTAPDNTIDTNFGYADGKTFYTNGAGWDAKKNKVIRTIIIGER